MIEISFMGRGGQGVVMASQILGMAFFKAGMYPQCYSLFGGERRGAPVVSFLRVDREKILLKCDIKHPDEMIFFDSTLINLKVVRDMMQQGGKVLVNTIKNDACLGGLSGFSVGVLDANNIADKLSLNHVINTILLGAYCRLTGHLSIEHIIQAVREMVPSKIEENIKAVQKGYENIEVVH